MSTLFISLKFSPGLFKEIICLADSCKKYDHKVHLILDNNYKKMKFNNPKELKINFIKNKLIYLLKNCFNLGFFNFDNFFIYNSHPLNIFLFVLIWLIYPSSRRIFVCHEVYKMPKIKNFIYRFIFLLVKLFNVITTWLSTDVVLLSEYAFNLYKADKLYNQKCNIRNSRILLEEVLINNQDERKYFSFVGRVVKTKKIDWFLNLAEYMLINNIKEELLILSASKLPKDKLQIFKRQGLKIKVINPKILSDLEISQWLKKSKAVFCLHKGITQSGVFVESMRHKTPIIGIKEEGLMQFFDNCGVLIRDPFNPAEIIKACIKINQNFSYYSENAEIIFKKQFSKENFQNYYSFLLKKKVLGTEA